ncbi:MAG: TIGR00375 family protein [Archaeoglobi archaeon]|nr:TIGR00375 family protein [Candidatus Mnemosynella sp.]
MHFNADLHIHSKFSGATSKDMELRILSKQAKKKGIDILGTGDCLHPLWLSEIREHAEGDEITLNSISFVLTAEIEDASRVHHLVLFPSFSKVEEVRERIKEHSNDIDSDGRPRVNLSGEELAEIILSADSLIGPSHAFTPWTSLYASFDSLRECYGEMSGKVPFVELGLSANSDYADRISELHPKTFLTNSDAHSPWPVRLAREFNRFEMQEATFDELKMAIFRERGRRPVLNVGIPPEEGKYNETACTRCYTHYSLQEARALKFRCKCGGVIKKGVKDRVEELADLREPVHPDHRPPYLHLIPLAEIIALAYNQRSPYSSKVQKIWEELVRDIGDEVKILVDVELDEIKDERIREAIRAFRERRIKVKPGGGGKYGELLLFEDGEEVEKTKNPQRYLYDF